MGVSGVQGRCRRQQIGKEVKIDSNDVGDGWWEGGVKEKSREREKDWTNGIVREKEALTFFVRSLYAIYYY